MAHPRIILLGCFPNLSPGEISIPNESLYDFSTLNIDGEGDMSFAKHASLFLKFFEYYEIDYEDVACIFFFLTLDGQASQWRHTLPPTSIHSLNHLIEEIYLAFDRYDYRDVYKRIDQLRMDPDESVEDFSNRFLNLCYEFPEEDMYRYFLKQNFKHLFHISLHGESKQPYVSSSSTLVNQETPIILDEEPIIPFVPCPPPFAVPMWVPPCNDYKVGKSTHQIPNPFSHPPSDFHDSNLEEISELLTKATV